MSQLEHSRLSEFIRAFLGEAAESLGPTMDALRQRTRPHVRAMERLDALLERAETVAEAARQFMKEAGHLFTKLIPIGGGKTQALVFRATMRFDNGEERAVIVKRFVDEAERQREQHALELINSGDHGLRGVAPMHAEGRWMAMEMASGTPVQDLAADKRGVACSRLAQVLTGFHRSRPTVTGEAKVEVIRAQASYHRGAVARASSGYLEGKVSEEDFEAIQAAEEHKLTAFRGLSEAYFSSDNLTLGVIHGDANPGNFLIDGESVTTYDAETLEWSHPGAGPARGFPPDDVARFLVSLADKILPDRCEAAAAAFLNSYRGQIPDDELKHGILLYMMRSLFTFRQYASDDEDRDRYDLALQRFATHLPSVGALNEVPAFIDKLFTHSDD